MRPYLRRSFSVADTGLVSMTLAKRKASNESVNAIHMGAITFRGANFPDVSP